MTNSALINLNLLNKLKKHPPQKIFYSSSACIYPSYTQMDENNTTLSEGSAYPASPDSEYGWEKLFSERLYMTYLRNYNIETRIARYHNIFGPEGTWYGGKEKSPAALCRKVIEAKNNSSIEVWGDGKQTRSFLFIDECIEGTRRLMTSNVKKVINIGSERKISINDLASIIIKISGKPLKIKNIEGPTGVRGRSSDNHLIRSELNWEPNCNLERGIEITFQWIEQEIKKLQKNEVKVA
jgi:nucleoside-diphosphate-sugar epimerase